MSIHELLRKRAGEVGLILFFVLAAGCNFDADRQYDLRFPVTLILRNETAGTVDITAIQNSPEAKNAFSLKGGSIVPAGSFSLKIPEGVYTDILAGSFLLRGICEGKSPWETSGRRLTRKDVHDAQRWDVTVSISTCDP